MTQDIFKYQVGTAFGIVKAIDEYEAVIKVRDYYRLDNCDSIIIDEIPDRTDVIEIYEMKSIFDGEGN